MFCGENKTMTYGISPSRFDSPLSLSHLSPSFSLVFIKKKKGPPVSTPNRKRPGPIETVNFCVGEYIS